MPNLFVEDETYAASKNTVALNNSIMKYFIRKVVLKYLKLYLY